MDMISGLRYAAKGNEGQMDPLVASAFSLSGRTAVVTGAAMGIGKETARTFARAGARVVLADRNAEQLEAATSEIEGAIAVPTDVSEKSAVEDLARSALKSTGRLDVWANVAGIIRNALIVEATEDDVDAIISVNQKGVYWGTAAAGRVMTAAGRGSIINVTSAGGEMAAPTLSIYGMTKAAVIYITRTAAAEFGPKGVRVNAIGPGFTESPMTSRAWTNPDGSIDQAAKDRMVSMRSGQSPLGVIGTPQDIAWSMLFLAADASSFMTGQVLRPNGGVVMG